MGEHGKYRPLVKRALAVGGLALCLATPAAACRLALVLAIDVSSSVDATEDRLQRQGLANALIAPDVVSAFFTSPAPVALLIFEWSGRYKQTDVVNWTIIDGPAALQAASTRLSQSTRSEHEFPTAMGYALGYAATKLTHAPRCMAQTIDLAGDGLNNDGFGPAQAYAAFPFDGVTVNGLVVAPSTATEAQDLISFYETDVIRGPASFVEVADGFQDYEAAMRRKLLRELSAYAIGAVDENQKITPVLHSSRQRALLIRPR